MARLDRGNHFLSGFGNENFIEEFYMDRGDGLKSSSMLSENEDSYKLELGIPYLKKEDIHLDLIGNKLTVVGTKPIKGESQKEKERKFISVFYIPTDVKMDQISATFKDGMLIVKLPKTKVEKVAQMIDLQ